MYTGHDNIRETLEKQCWLNRNMNIVNVVNAKQMMCRGGGLSLSEENVEMTMRFDDTAVRTSEKKTE